MRILSLLAAALCPLFVCAKAEVQSENAHDKKVTIAGVVPGTRAAVSQELRDGLNALPTKPAQIEFLIAQLPDKDAKTKTLTNRSTQALWLLGVLGSPKACSAIIDRLEFKSPSDTNAAIEALQLLGEPAVEPIVDALREDNRARNKIACKALRRIKGAGFALFMRQLVERKDLSLSPATVEIINHERSVTWTD